ncbi:MAG TPA: hypothetical protein VHG93_01555, partial [Longimicrobium sp.]|nr:hypothetical protein [Longimicrobium sp.]
MRLPRLLLPLLALAGGCDSPVEAPLPPREYAPGERVAFNVQLSDGRLCAGDERVVRTARVAAVSARAVVVADEGNPAGGYGDDDFRALAAAFDTQVWPVVAANFGEPHDVDGNRRVVLLFTRAVNEQASAGQGWYVGGAFAARDLFPAAGSGRLGACPGSNQAELIYMPVPDPEGVVNGTRRTRDAESRRAPALLAHELQHVVNASRRLYGGGAVGADWNEEPWLNEGLSHVAEELMAYATSDLRPRQGLTLDAVSASADRQDAFSRFVYPNFTWAGYWLADPAAASAYGADTPAARGAAWQFLRYAADRRG